MANSFTTTVGTTDYTFDWIAQEIHIQSGVTNVSAADLKTAIHDAQDEVVGIYYDPIADFFNPVVLTATSSTFLNVVLRDQWRIDSLSSSGTMTIGNGNVVNVNNGIDIFAPNPLVNMVNNVSAAGVLVVSGSGVVPQDVIDIKNAVFNEIMEDTETFAEQIRIIRAEAAGDIERSGDTHLIKAANGTKTRITATANANGRDVTTVDGT